MCHRVAKIAFETNCKKSNYLATQKFTVKFCNGVNYNKAMPIIKLLPFAFLIADTNALWHLPKNMV